MSERPKLKMCGKHKAEHPAAAQCPVCDADKRPPEPGASPPKVRRFGSGKDTATNPQK